RLVTSQLLSTPQSENLSATAPPPIVRPQQEVRIEALEQEKDGPVYKLRGHVAIQYGTFNFYADEITYNSETGEATAQGHVVLDGGPNDEHIEASDGSYNLRSESGTFHNVIGTIGLRIKGSATILTSSSPFALAGKTVQKTGPDHYLVEDGSVTTCELPRPKWTFNAHKATVDVTGNAVVYRSSFRIRDVPIFYFPYAAFPAQRLGRKSGFLIPSFGRSSTKGTIVGDSFYWAINRSMDATVGAEYFSQRGWAERGQFRARPSDTSYLDLNYFGVIDRKQQGGEEVTLAGEGRFLQNFRAVSNIDYLSSFVFRLAFSETFTQAVNSEVKSLAFLSNTTRGFSYNALVQRYQDFESSQNGDVITILHAPSFGFSSVDRRLGRTPLYWSLDSAAEGLSRSEPGFRTANLVGRFDLTPAISMPLSSHGWSLRPELALRDTLYTQQLLPNGNPSTAVSDPINRKALQASVDLHFPSLSRVFDRKMLGRKVKHVIEPHATYRYVTGINNFAKILRFDARDILSDTNEVEYRIVNRLFSKRNEDQAEDCNPTSAMSSLRIGAPAEQIQPWERTYTTENLPCSAGPQVREIVTWELAQKYFLDPDFNGALVNGRRNVLTTTADFSGIAFLTQPRHLSPLISRLRVRTSSQADAEWDVDYDFQRGRINASTALLNYHIGNFTLGGGDAYVQALPGLTVVPNVQQDFNQFRILAGYGNPSKRGFSGATSFGFDANLGFLQYASAQTTYNWDCCGVTVEYRRFALGSVRNENQFRFSFTLANIGSVGNLRKQERLY
ncbi:MAG TPA: LPS assembly protein LptD, partial [Terriglobales bacterium]|nr:LPS assembly protein LptD [Terriglobales bacterium]